MWGTTEFLIILAVAFFGVGCGFVFWMVAAKFSRERLRDNDFGLQNSTTAMGERSWDSTELTETVQSHLRQGRKIEAIKIYREHTGVGLKEAKDAVDAIERQM